jgi:nucleoside-diphosphate-sugar epimerase
MLPSPEVQNETATGDFEPEAAWPSTLIIGAGGFIGSWVAKVLSDSGAIDTRLGIRRESPRLAELSLERIYCDILDATVLNKAMNGIEVVVNCVRDHAEGATIKGTKVMLAAARAAGVKRIVQFSSIAVYGDARGVVTEADPTSPVDQYGAEKVAAEYLCKHAAGPDLTIAIIRPALVYGPHGEEWTGRFIRGILSGNLRKRGTSGQGQANLIYAEDLGCFVADLVRQESLPFSVYNVNGPEIPTFDKYFDLLSQALGRGPLPLIRKPRIQFELTRQARRAVRLILRTQGPKLRKLAQSNQALESGLSSIAKHFQYDICDEPRDRFANGVVYSNDSAQRIGFRPKTTLSEGIAASIEWAKQSGATGASQDENAIGFQKGLVRGSQSSAATR